MSHACPHCHGTGVVRSVGRPRRIDDSVRARIKDLRSTGFKREVVAKMFGVNPRTVSEICNGS
jgi:hypothetical protein